MTILSTGFGSRVLSMAAGETLLIRNFSGTETVTGSTVAREDVSARYGAGACAYGPQTSATSVTLSSSGSLDYQVLVGDASPAEVVQANSGQFTTDAAKQAVRGAAGGVGATLFNFDRAQYIKTRKAISGARQGVSNAKFLRIGNSTELGRGVVSSGYTGAGTTSGPAPRFTALCNSLGLGTFRNDSYFGSWVASLSGLDSRVTAGSGWNPTGAYGLGANVFANSSTTTNLSFTPANQTDTFVVWYIDTGGGTFSLQVNSGTAQNTTAGSTTQFKTATISGTLGANTYNIARVSGTVYIAGVWAYNSASKEISVFSSGWPGAKMTDYVGSGAYSLLNHLKVVAPDLTLLKGSINDWSNSTDVSAFKADMQSLITAAKLSGDVLLVTELPSQISSASLSQQKVYVDAMKDVAVSNSIALLDHWSYFGSWEDMGGTGGGWFDDSVHGTKYSYDAMAFREAQAIRLILE